MKTNKIGHFLPSINEILIVLAFSIIIVFGGSCSKDYYPKQFPPVQSCPDLPVVVYGGEEYPTVLIENRCWMAKNLNIGIMLSDTLQMTDNGVIEKYCYEADTTNCKIYGALYVWDEAMQYKSEEGSRGICPEGWHIPTNREFVDLFIYVDNFSEYLIENRDTLWIELEDSENYNLTGFSAIPAGIRNNESYYFGLQSHTIFWCSKKIDDGISICFNIPWYSEINNQYRDKKNGFSIRCIKDE